MLSARTCPYTPWDKAFVADTLKKIGVEPGAAFDFDALDAESQEMVLSAQASAFDKIIATGDEEFGTRMNGWLLNPAHHGDWKDDYMNRAYATYTGGMYPVTDNSTYATTYDDVNGDPIDGRHNLPAQVRAG